MKNAFITIIKTYKNRLKRKPSISFNLTSNILIKKYQEQDGKCIFTGDKLSFKNNINKVTISRINFRNNFTKENTKLVTWKANYIRNHLRHDFNYVIKEIVNNCKNYDNLECIIHKFTRSQRVYINKLLNTCQLNCLKRKRKNRLRSAIFKIKIKDIEMLYSRQRGKCAYSGMNLSFRKMDKYKLSIDRIDSDLGYTIDNIHLVCWIINQAKGNMSDYDFLQSIHKIYKKKK